MALLSSSFISQLHQSHRAAGGAFKLSLLPCCPFAICNIFKQNHPLIQSCFIRPFPPLDWCIKSIQIFNPNQCARVLRAQLLICQLFVHPHYRGTIPPPYRFYVWLIAFSHGANYGEKIHHTWKENRINFSLHTLPFVPFCVNDCHKALNKVGPSYRIIML